MRMLRIVVWIVVITASVGIAYAGGSTALTYQGRLLDAGAPANGLFNVDFSLWDHSAGGIQIGSTIMFISLPISDGLFTVELDFGANAFDNTDRWLEIVVDGVPLAPRQPITRAPYAIQTRGIVVDDNQLVGMGVSPGQQRLRVWNFAGGGAFEAVSSNRAIEAISTEGDVAILASNQSADGMGVFAQHQPSQNQAWLGSPDYGVYGRANDLANDWAGYFLGRAHVSDTLFVGREDPLTFAEYFGFNAPVDSGYGGMYISTNTVDGWPFYGYAAGSNGDMWHYYDGSTGKWHLHNGSERLTVQSNGNVGIGNTAPEYTLHVVSAGQRTIFAVNTNTVGNFQYGVYGQTDSDGILSTGVYGIATDSRGSTRGVAGQSNSPTGVGVHGRANAVSGTGIGVWGVSVSPDGYGVYSQGNCHVQGTLSKSGGAFKIDHPLDPVNKYLQHSFVESPDMMNVYNGNVILDENGTAYVGLPDYFDELNRDFRYQLTPMGAAMPNLHISQEIANNSFQIAGGKARMKVSWQVTGIRQDPWAEAHRIEVAPYKRPEHQGKYLNPELYGQPKEMAVHYFPDAERPVTETTLAKAQAGPTPNPSTGEIK